MNKITGKAASVFALTVMLTIGASEGITYSAPSQLNQNNNAENRLAISAESSIKEEKVPIEYGPVPTQSDGMFHDGLLLANKANGKDVFYNSKGKEAFTLSNHLIPITDFHNQRALVEDTSTKLGGYINTKGELVIPCIYAETTGFSDGIAFVKKSKNDNGAFITSDGESITNLKKSYSSDYSFSEGLALAYSPNNDKIGYLNKKGTLVIPYTYKYGRSFSENAVAVQNSQEKYGFIDSKGKVIVPFQYQNAGDFSQGLAPVQNESGLWGYINKKGEVVIPFQYALAYSFSEGLAAVYNKQGKAGYVNKQGKLMIGYQYNKALSFGNGMAAVGVQTKTGRKYGYINTDGKLVTPLRYKRVNSFHENMAVASISDQTAVILTK